MKAVLTDDTVVDCAGFKALDPGVVLFADERRHEALGFLPTGRLRYILPAPAEETPPERDQEAESAAAATVEADVEDVTAEEDEEEEEEKDEEAEEGKEEEPAEDARQLTAFATDGTEISCRGFKALDSGVVLFADAERTDVAGFVPREGLEIVLADDALAAPTEPATAGDERFVDAETLVSEEGTDEQAVEGETGTFEAVDVDEGEASTDVGETSTDVGETSTDVGETSTDVGEAETAETGEVDESTEGVEVVDLGAEEKLTRLAGLGETYAERLRAHGIASVSDLRATSVDELAKAADVPTGRAERWKSQVE